MAAVQPSNVLETQLYRHFVPHLANPKTRYAIFALGILSSAGLAWQFGKAPLLCTVVPATLVVLAQKNFELLHITEFNQHQKSERSAKLAYHCFVIAGIWGIVLSGSTLALTCEAGQLLVKGVPSLNLLSVIKGINSLANIGWFWAPLSWYFLHRSNEALFGSVPSTLQASIEQFITVIQEEVSLLIKVETFVSHLTTLYPVRPRINRNSRPLLSLFNFLRSFDYKSYLPAQVQGEVADVENQVGEILSQPFPQSLADAQEKLPTLKRKVFAIVKNSFSPPADQEKRQRSEGRSSFSLHPHRHLSAQSSVCASRALRRGPWPWLVLSLHLGVRAAAQTIKYCPSLL